MTRVFFYYRVDTVLNAISHLVKLIITFLAWYRILSFSYRVDAKVDKLLFVDFTRIFGIIVASIAVQFHGRRSGRNLSWMARRKLIR